MDMILRSKLRLLPRWSRHDLPSGLRSCLLSTGRTASACTNLVIHHSDIVLAVSSTVGRADAGTTVTLELVVVGPFLVRARTNNRILCTEVKIGGGSCPVR